jgi:hypothetical protein
MNTPTTIVVDAELGDGLTREQREAQERARRLFAERDRRAEAAAANAVRAAEQRMPADSTALDRVYQALVDVCRLQVDITPLLPKQESEKGKG